ncbi:MEDS domain-containing protein [Actinoplanes sp. URMC 104]|uniref:MEDS domain-containing protein n=1 Tax=Actinoplanes sp. URMC 104 TaxID=3423409 RepID=UPI003F194022
MSSDPSPATGHVCLAFDSRADLESRARAFLAAGEAAGEQVSFVAPGVPQLLLPFVPLGDTYPDGAVIDPAEQVAFYAAATEQALAAGYTGLRVVADVTPLVRTPAQLDAFARYEFRADRYSQEHPFTAMCAYDRGELGDDIVAQVACMHTSTVPPVPFRLHACASAEGCGALAGELDRTSDDLFTTALRRADLVAAGGEVVLRADGLRFADHGSLLRLDDYAARRGVTVVLRGASRAVQRLAELLELTCLRVEAAR